MHPGHRQCRSTHNTLSIFSSRIHPLARCIPRGGRYLLTAAPLPAAPLLRPGRRLPRRDLPRRILGTRRPGIVQIGVAPLHELTPGPHPLLHEAVVVLHGAPAVRHVRRVDLAGVLPGIAVVVHPLHLADRRRRHHGELPPPPLGGAAGIAGLTVLGPHHRCRSARGPGRRRRLGRTALRGLAVSLTPVGPNTLEDRSVLVLHLALAVRLVIFAHVPRVPPLPVVLVAVPHVLDAYLLLPAPGRPAAPVGAGLGAGVVEDAAGAPAGPPARPGPDAPPVLRRRVLGAVGADVVQDLPPPQGLLLRESYRGVGVAVPLLVERECAEAIGLATALPGAVGLDAPRALLRPGAASGPHGAVVGHVVVVRVDALGTVAELPPAPEELLLRDLYRGMAGAAAGLVEFPRRRDGLRPGLDRLLRGARRDGLGVVVAPAPGPRPRLGPAPARPPAAPPHARGVLLVPRLDAPRAPLVQHLPPPPELLGRHLDVGVVMAPPVLVEGGAELLVHVPSGLDRVAQGVRHAVEGPAALDYARAAEGGHPAGLVELRGALVAVLGDVYDMIRRRRCGESAGMSDMGCASTTRKSKGRRRRNSQTTRDAVQFRMTTHHLDLLVHELPILLHGFSELYGIVLEAVPILVEGRTVERGLDLPIILGRRRRGHALVSAVVAATAGGLGFGGRFGRPAHGYVLCVVWI